MKRKKHNKTEVYTDAQLTALLKKSEVVISSSKNDNKNTPFIFVSELTINKVLHKKMKYCYSKNNNALKKVTNDLQL